MAIVKNLVVGDKSLLDLTYPVGSVYSSTNSTDPSDLFGGTWKSLEGMVLVGVDSNDTDFSASKKTGGEKTHTLTESEMPNHHHEFAGKINSDTDYQGDWVASWGYSGQYYQDGVWHPRMGNTTSVGGGLLTTICLHIILYICGSELLKSHFGSPNEKGGLV